MMGNWLSVLKIRGFVFDHYQTIEVIIEIQMLASGYQTILSEGWNIYHLQTYNINICTTGTF